MIDKYNRTGRSAEYTEISIQFKDGETQTIENDKTKKLTKDIALAKELLGWSPKIGIKDGLKRTIAYFKNLNLC